MLLEVYGHRRKSEFPIPFVIGIDFPVFIINKFLRNTKFLIVLPFENKHKTYGVKHYST